MRRFVAVAIALAAVTVGAAPAVAVQRISATPSVVEFGETLTVKGRGWPVIEFCSRRVRISLRSDQNAFTLGTVRVRASGRFTFRWVPRASRVGAGRWTVVARMRCESGDDGSTIFQRALDRIRIAG